MQFSKRIFLSMVLLVSMFCAAPAEVLEFTSPICAPCNQWKPTIERIVGEGRDIRVVDVTTSTGRDLAARYGVDRTPTLVAVLDGKEVDRNVGICDDARVYALLDKAEKRLANQNFDVSVVGDANPAEMRAAAEKWRSQMATYWLGKELPAWSAPCQLSIRCAPDLGAGGTTTFVFDRGEVGSFKSSVQGSRESVLQSVLPHEISHMIFASYFRAPLPRWADEGAAASVESAAEQRKYQNGLTEYLKTERGIPFDRMLTMREYPSDVMPLYSQGHSVASWLIEKNGPQKFMAFIADGLRDDNWTRAVKDCYGFSDALTMQNAWVAYIKSQKPLSGKSETLVAAHTTNYLAAVCSISVDNGSHGDGALIAPDRVLTAWHLFREPANTVQVTFGTERVQGRLLVFDSVNDAAIIALDHPVKIAPLQVNVCDELPTGRVSIAAFDGRQGVVRTTGVAEAGYTPTNPDNPDRCLKVVGAVTLPGDSGGPVIDERGYLVGVHWGGNTPVRDAVRETCACAGRSLRNLLRGVGIVVRCPPAEQRVIVRPVPLPVQPQSQCAPAVDWQGKIDTLAQRIEKLESGKQDRGDYATVGQLPQPLDLSQINQENADNKTAIDQLKQDIASRVHDNSGDLRKEFQERLRQDRESFENRLSDTRTEIEAKIPAASGVVVDWGVKSVLVGLGITGGPAALAAWLAASLVRRRVEKRIDDIRGQGVRGDAPFQRAA